jgi:TonB family protein
LKTRLLISLGLALGFSAAALSAPPDDSIERALDRGKGKLHAVYSRALRGQPELKGRIDLQFTVGTDGRATRCRVLHSELQSAQVEKKLCDAVEAMAFDPRQAPSTVVKRFDFFPATEPNYGH